jgi:hypothetical protein
MGKSKHVYAESQTLMPHSGNLSFHAVAFGPSIATLQRMVQLATTIQNRAPADPMKPQVPSSYTAALDSVRAHAPRVYSFLTIDAL